MPNYAPLSLHSFHAGMELAKSDPPFYALIAAAMVKADTHNAELLRACWPQVFEDAQKRYNAPNGMIEGD